MATVREEAIKTVSESRTTLLTSRVRRQRYTTLPCSRGLLRRHLPSSSARGPSSSSRAIIIIHIWIRDCPMETRAHGPRRYPGLVYVMALVIGDVARFWRRFFFRENCDAASQWKWCLWAAVTLFFFFPFHTPARYGDVKLCRRVRGEFFEWFNVISKYVRCNVQWALSSHSYHHFAISFRAIRFYGDRFSI